MNLQRYLKITSTPVKDFAQRIGVDQATVRRYIDGTRRPSLGTLQRIVTETGGAVGMESFFAPAASAGESRTRAGNS